MALRREIELVRERLRRMPKRHSLVMILVFAGVVGVIAFGAAFFLLRKQTPPEQAAAGYCQPCTTLMRLERATDVALRHDESFATPTGADDRERVMSGIRGWQRRCTTLLCSRPANESKSCAPPSVTMMTELAAIDNLSESLLRR